ncbi:hypothetical protein [uncultured Croceicoccus sp.]|jgi:hypothetical protein|uniref:hypothetical protein n=1 Tax=uncultured Croceicoccus sp. TaxID=1295329 RepID=UPI00261D5C42|nr:hypothetical protein [uncultured Croceicoccus sp.]
MKLFAPLAAAILLASPAMAEEITPLPVAVASEQKPRAVLPANTEILLSMNQDVTTKGKGWSEGDTFNMSVVHDVRYGDYIVIPRGSRGVGRITWLTNKGAFGKSGKMNIELEYVEVAGQRIDVSGEYRQEGDGNTLATVGGVVAAGVFAAFITGKSGTIPKGRELMAYTKSDIPLAIELPVAAAAPALPVAAPVAPSVLKAQPVVQAVPGEGAALQASAAPVAVTSSVVCTTCKK